MSKTNQNHFFVRLAVLRCKARNKLVKPMGYIISVAHIYKSSCILQCYLIPMLTQTQSNGIQLV